MMKLKAIHYFAVLFFCLTVLLSTVMVYEMSKGHFWFNGSVQTNKEARTVFVKEAVFQQLGEVFSLKKEKIFCLFGSQSDSQVLINQAIEDTVTVSEQEWNRISFTEVPCSNMDRTDFIGTIHTHPSGVCFPSPPDVYLWGQISLIKPGMAGNGVMCENDLFTFFEIPRNENGFELKTNPIVRWA